MKKVIKKAIPRKEQPKQTSRPLYTIRIHKSIIERNFNYLCGVIFLLGITVMIWGCGLL